MRVECVKDAAVFIETKRNPSQFTAGPDVLEYVEDRVVTPSLFFLQMLRQILTARYHIWVEFERLELSLDLNVPLKAFDSLFKIAEPKCAPRARDVGNKIDM